MWVSKRKWNSLEKRIADLEKETQSQRNGRFSGIGGEEEWKQPSAI